MFSLVSRSSISYLGPPVIVAIAMLGLTLDSGQAFGQTGSKEARSQKPNAQNSAAQKPAAKKPVAKKPVAKKPAPKFRWVNPLGKNASKLVRHASFESTLVSQAVGYGVLLPPKYETNDKRYPVVYYLHGGRPGSEAKSIGLTSAIEDAMESGAVPAMIYVFVNGGPVSHYNVPGQDGAIGADVFIEELIPHIDATYRTIADRKGRGLEGFSQGGRATMRLSLRYPDLFVSAAAGGGGYETEHRISLNHGEENPNLVFAEGDNTWDLARAYDSSDPKVNWMIYVGTKGFNYQNNLEYMAFLNEQGIPFQKLIVPGVKHSGKAVYDQKAIEIMNFHAANFGLMESEPSQQ